MIMSHTVVFPDAVPPDTPSEPPEEKKTHQNFKTGPQRAENSKRERPEETSQSDAARRGRRRLPITKGLLVPSALGEANPLAAEASGVPLPLALADEGGDGSDEEERRRESRRSPLKWGPTAESITSSIPLLLLLLPPPATAAVAGPR
jgi:hypothetical protein